jgi:hypothetical protein
MDLIGVVLVFAGCQGTILALLLPLPLLQVSIIFRVSFILGHLKNNNVHVAFNYKQQEEEACSSLSLLHFFFKEEKRKQEKENIKKRKD